MECKMTIRLGRSLSIDSNSPRRKGRDDSKRKWRYGFSVGERELIDEGIFLFAWLKNNGGCKYGGRRRIWWLYEEG
ncbi:hypothetical protein MTR67_035230 [Solanum verrucosum]|uniref:Uncharacterized protein n=1 Tax=Solanum verrucosum TaxID=315347 RepID=A0AAF0U9H6_SOLVR|nr:hypothetical protein MTR67_035230 [Solanum verrucosum]